MKGENYGYNLDKNGLGMLELSNLSTEELGKIKALEDEINKNHHGDRVSLMALNTNTTIR